MCGEDVWIYATYESDTIPQNIFVGFIKNSNGAERGFAVFRYDTKTDSYKIKGYESHGRDGLSCVTIAQDWGLDHSVTVILSGRSDLSYVTVESGGELYQRETIGKIASPGMLVIEWPELLSEEKAAAVEVHYYNELDQELR